MSRQGVVIKDVEINKIVHLLYSTDLPIPVIAERMGCSRSTIVGVNRKYGIRCYAGRHNNWTILKEENKTND